MKKRYDELVEIINEANYNYHTLDKPTITDQEYDKYLRELYVLEEKHPELKIDNSPTNRAGGQVLEGFDKVEHKVPMLSLSNVFNEEELISFDNRIKKAGIENPAYICELKIDGLSFALHYEKGRLVTATTRGDGQVGENITNNVMTIKTVPLVLKEPIDIEVRGEIFMGKDVFIELNKKRVENGEQAFQNPRNAAAGSVRQLDSKVTSQRKLDCFIYHIPNAIDLGIKTQEEALSYLEKLGFKVSENNKRANNISDVISYINKSNELKETLNYEIDGVVVKLNSFADQEKLGFNARTPKWASSYKYPAQDTYTKLLDIIFTVGRTGQITPNAVLEPVLVQGSTIQRATLHNEDYIIEKNLKIGDIVSVRKAADVIPEVSGVLLERRDGSQKDFEMITDCPICSTQLIKRQGQVDHFCPNPNCEGRGIGSLVHFASRGAMNIDGLGERIIEILFSSNYLRKFSDIYKLNINRQELIELAGFGEKSIDKLLKAIENSKENSLERLLFGLGIANVGEKTAKILAQEYNNLDNLIKASADDLIKINDIGDIIAKSIVDYFADSENLAEIEALKAAGLCFDYLGVKTASEGLAGKTFVVTGSLDKYTRGEIHDLIEAHGAKTSSTVSKKTSYVIAGLEAGSKLEKAKQLNVPILSEEDFEIMMKDI